MHDRARYADAAPNTADPVRDHADHPVDAAVEARPGTERTDPQDSGGGRVCAERREHAALAVPRDQGRGDQADYRGLLQARMGRTVAPRYRAGEPAPSMNREQFLRTLDAAEYLAALIH